ncbi:hypothetical protein RhiJN_07904 [Ceratobasidium sp. AG-Ba]|nr:hypothetical protein RhiJN_07904 [Ceratobasidium sp. AG-Ba]
MFSQPITRGDSKRVRRVSLEQVDDEDGGPPSSPGLIIHPSPRSKAPDSKGKGKDLEDKTRDVTPLKEELESLFESRQKIATNSHDAEMASRAKKAELGSAFILGCGPGNLHNVLNMKDPRTRLNPRPFNPAHGHRLYRDVFIKGMKMDSRSPLLLVGHRSSFSKKQLERMSECDASDPSKMPPLLQLNHPNIEKINFLEGMIWLGKLENGKPRNMSHVLSLSRQ